MTTIEVKVQKGEASVRFLGRMRGITWERLDADHLNITAEDEDIDGVTEVLDDLKLEWALV